MVLIIVGLIVVGIILGKILSRIRRKYRVQMITCVIRPEQLGDVTAALKREKLMIGMTLLDVRGFGRQKGGLNDGAPREGQTLRLLPKLKLEILVGFPDVERTMETLGVALHTGQIGDGKIIVYNAVHAMRVRTGERGVDAL